ncbi:MULTISPECIES: pyridoxamine 5'-phosphate oxidase family protein [unclassified Curtobacterium]|uniref:pyridoxamine 5'-phosphate oxidase family protein n=1 Tax=unclassified Curtobacterium TaxID=257496 RepID=UPI000DA728B2|nr:MULTISPECIES: pyridoxamine 5'-phosphate oxidase family protein [unclassified Curtobacterium]PZE23250.1 hypothetical protein DEI86_14995 [Curtobacterium sp. MCBD17_028]PZE72857.1 hypothetical protein DEI82_14645 [Curtobacterium sp. MCBD17_019]
MSEHRNDPEPVPTRTSDRPGAHASTAPVEELVLVLDPDQCWTRLRDASTGRVAFRTDESIEILPVNHLSDDRQIVFATSSHAILAAVADRRELVFEVDHHDGWTAWSVVVRGPAHTTQANDGTAGRLRSMLPTPKIATVVIEPTTVTGRLFDRAAP